MAKTGWVPDQHGAWVMVTVPLLLGIYLAGPAWVHVPLAVAWMSGYFAFFAGGLWLKARRRRDAYRRPLLTYGIVSAIATLTVIALCPRVLWWALYFVPLVAIAVWEAYKKRPRSMLSGVSTVLASCAMIPIGSWVVGEPLDTQLVKCTLLFGFYFVGTIPYVKTLIRKRGNRAYLRGSLLYHLLAVGAASCFGWLPGIIFVTLLFRAWWMPWIEDRRVSDGGRRWSPKQVGMLEGLWTLAVGLGAFA